MEFQEKMFLRFTDLYTQYLLYRQNETDERARKDAFWPSLLCELNEKEIISGIGI